MVCVYVCSLSYLDVWNQMNFNRIVGVGWLSKLGDGFWGVCWEKKIQLLS